MNDPMTEPEQLPKFLIAIRQEFERAEPRRRTPRAGVLVVATVVGLLSVGGVAAATGLIGKVIPDSEKDVHAGPGPEFVVASGASPVAGAWRLTSLRHQAEDGEGAGDCLKLELTSPPPGTPIIGTLLCQTVGEARFKANSIPVVDASTGRAEALVFGAVPKTATSVVAGGVSAGPALAKAAEFPGNAWVVAIPSAAKGSEITWSQDGKARGSLDASPYLEQLAIWRRNILGDGS